MPAIDLHQHLWPEAFVELLRGRTRAPYLRGWTLHTDGEPPYDVDPADHDVDRRIALDRDAGIGLACVSLSAPLGIESLPRDEAGALIDAWHRGASALPAHFAPWASVPGGRARSRRARRAPGRARSSACSCRRPSWPRRPAGRRSARCCGWPSSPASRCSCTRARRPSARRPSWWAPVVGYVGAAAGGLVGMARLRRARAVPALRWSSPPVPGWRPLQHERLAARGGRLGTGRPATCSSTPRPTAPRRSTRWSRALGIDAIVLGSDRPVRRAGAVGPRRGGDPGDPGRQPAACAGQLLGTIPMEARRMSTTAIDVPARAATPARGRPDPRRPARPRPRRARAALAGVVPRRPARPLAAPPGVRRRQPGLRLAAPRRPRRRVAALLDPRERHRLPRPRHLLRRGRGRRAGRSSSTTSPSATRPSRRCVEGGRVFSFGPDHIHRLTCAEQRVGVGARLQPAAVADGPVRRRRRRSAAAPVGVVRRRAAAHRLNNQ